MTIPIYDAKTHPNYQKYGGYRGVLMYVSMQKHGLLPNFDEIDHAAPKLYAWVCRGSWVVTCPTCKDQYVCDLDDDLFFCPTCQNAATGGKARKITFQNGPRQRNIERVLRSRANPNSRNYIPDDDLSALVYGGQRFKETTQSLRNENAAHSEPEYDEPLESEGAESGKGKA